MTRSFWRSTHQVVLILSLTTVLSAFGKCVAGEPNTDTATLAGKPASAKIQNAVQSGLRILRKGAQNYPEHRDCFSCHHQTLPLLAMTSARLAGLEVDEKLFAEQTEFTRKSMAVRRESLLHGDGVGGRALTAGYALWTMQIARVASDETTEALVKYLVRIQNDDGSFRPQSFRPPISESAVSCTAMTLSALRHYGKGKTLNDDGIQNAIERADKFLDAAKPDTQEAFLFRLLWSKQKGTSFAQFADDLKTLRSVQREDGGWGQLAGNASDAYATGQTLFVLMKIEFPLEDPLVERSIGYLLNTQKSDGSWHVKTRSKPMQTWFDNGDPHGDDQFISIAGTAWATAGLAEWLATPAVAE